MPRRSTADEWDDDYDDEEEDESTVACHFCRRQIHEDAERCPYCGNFVTDEDAAAAPDRKPLWIIVGSLLVMYMVYRWSFG